MSPSTARPIISAFILTSLTLCGGVIAYRIATPQPKPPTENLLDANANKTDSVTVDFGALDTLTPLPLRDIDRVLPPPAPHVTGDMGLELLQMLKEQRAREEEMLRSIMRRIVPGTEAIKAPVWIGTVKYNITISPEKSYEPEKDNPPPPSMTCTVRIGSMTRAEEETPAEKGQADFPPTPIVVRTDPVCGWNI